MKSKWEFSTDLITGFGFGVQYIKDEWEGDEAWLIEFLFFRFLWYKAVE